MAEKSALKLAQLRTRHYLAIMNALIREFKHTLAGKPITFDHYDLVNEIFGRENFFEVSPSHTKTKPLDEAFKTLKAKGLSDEQIRALKSILKKSIESTLDAPTKSPVAFRLAHSNQSYLGATFNNTAPPEALIKKIKTEFLDKLTHAMNWEEEKRSKEEIPSPAELASGRKINVSIGPLYLEQYKIQ